MSTPLQAVTLKRVTVALPETQPQTTEMVVRLPTARSDQARASEQLARTLPTLLGDVLQEVAVGVGADGSCLELLLVMDAVRLTSDHLVRVRFWSERVGGTFLPATRARARLLEAGLKVKGDALAWALEQALGEDPDNTQRLDGALEPQLSVDLTGGPSATVREVSGEGLFVASQLSPPLWDRMRLAVAVPGGEVHRVWAHVVDIRGCANPALGSPAGFTLRFEGAPPELTVALDTLGVEEHTRPVQVVRAVFTRRQEFDVAYRTQLSQGGVWVAGAGVIPRGTPVRLDVVLPDGTVVEVPAQVAHVDGSGLGLGLRGSALEMDELAAAHQRLMARPRRVLLVDDDRLWSRMMADELKSQGVEVVAAANGQDALRVLAVEQGQVQAMVVDVHMPVMNGAALVNEVRARGAAVVPTLVVVSADDSDERRDSVVRAGADAFMSKRDGAANVAQQVLALATAQAQQRLSA